MSFKDKTFCTSINCINECGRQMSIEDKKQMNELIEKGEDVIVSQGYFCGVPSKNEDSRPTIALNLQST